MFLLTLNRLAHLPLQNSTSAARLQARNSEVQTKYHQPLIQIWVLSKFQDKQRTKQNQRIFWFRDSDSQNFLVAILCHILKKKNTGGTLFWWSISSTYSKKNLSEQYTCQYIHTNNGFNLFSHNFGRATVSEGIFVFDSNEEPGWVHDGSDSSYRWFSMDIVTSPSLLYSSCSIASS